MMPPSLPYYPVPAPYLGVPNGGGPPQPYIVMPNTQYTMQQFQGQCDSRNSSVPYDITAQLQLLGDHTTSLRKHLEATNENVQLLMNWKQEVNQKHCKKRKINQVCNGPPSNMIAGASEDAVLSLKDIICQWATLNQSQIGIPDGTNVMETFVTPVIKRMQGI